MRSSLQRLEKDKPTVALGAGAASQGDREREAERRKLPSPFRAPALDRHTERHEEILCRAVLPVRLLHAWKHGELIARAEMDLEPASTIDNVVIHALGVPAVVLAARLPAALQDVSRVAGKRGELRRGRSREPYDQDAGTGN